MEEALQQLVTDSLDLSRRKSVGPTGQITVTMDTRALAPDHRIFFRNLHKFRVSQMNEGVDLTELSDEQWGMVQLDKCHHISTTSTSKDGPQSFRVRICKTCCQEDSHIELGTYVDQESAILVNDTFEILNERLDRLIVLRVEDKPDLHYLVAKKYDRSKGRDYACILDLIAERITAIEGKKRKPSVSEMIPAFAKRSGDGVSTGSAENGSNTQYSSCSTSSEASDELRTASRLSTTKSLSVANSHVSLHSALSGSSSRNNTARKRDSGRRISISSAPDEEVASNSGSASTIDDEITVTEEHNENNATNAALRELSSVCYQRLLSPSIANIVTGSADLSAGTVVAGSSLFSHPGPSELVRSSLGGMEKLRSSSNLSSMGSAARRSVDKFNLGSPFSASNDVSSPTSHTTALNAFSGFNSSIGSAERPVPSSSGGLNATAEKVHTSSTHKRNRGAQDDSADASSIAASAAYSSSYDRLVVDGQTPRKRAATFSVSEPYPYYAAYQAEQNPIATLTWLASMEDVEVDVARSLYELRGNSGAGLFDARTTSGAGSSSGMDHRFTAHSSYESYRSATSNEMHGGYGHGYGAEDGDEDGNEGGEGCEMRYGDADGDGDCYDQDNDNDDEDMDEHDLAQMDMYYRQHAVGLGGAGSKPYGYPTTFHHNGKTYNHSMGGTTNAGPNGGFTRMRSSSMSMIERSEAAWAILGSTGGYRSKMDPLSMALKKYHERGGSANAAAQGFVGIYSPEDRKSRIMRFLEKRKRRMWTKKVKYDVRKNFADSRVRVKGRFVKKQDEDDAASPGDRERDRLNTSHASNSSYDQDTSYYQEDGEDMEPDEPVRAPTPAQSLNLKLKVTKSSTGGSGSKRRDSKDSRAAEVKVDSKLDGSKADAAKGELKLTFSSRRRRHSSAEESDLALNTSTASADGSLAAHSASADAHDPLSGSPSSNVALKLERANLNSGIKPAPIY